MTKTQLVAALAEVTQQSKKDVIHFLGALEAVVLAALKADGKVDVGICVLKVVDRKARLGRNPATGESIKIAAKRSAKASVKKSLKDALGLKATSKAASKALKSSGSKKGKK